MSWRSATTVIGWVPEICAFLTLSGFLTVAKGLESPILLIVFNRPESTFQVFERIGRAKPPRLYIAADGPESQNASDAELCAQVRAVREKVSWPCEVKTWYPDEHFGPDRGVAVAVDWFFQNEAEGIILEDDCLPEEAFFSFCDELLERYRDDNRVMHVCGINPLGSWDREPYGYYFSRHATSGGWAGWRRAWQLKGFSKARYEAIRGHGFFDEYFPTSAEKLRWFEVFNSLSENPDPQARWRDRWAFSRFIQSGLSIVPRQSLVAHLPDGVAKDTWMTNQGLVHPPYVMRSMEADTAYANTI